MSEMKRFTGCERKQQDLKNESAFNSTIVGQYIPFNLQRNSFVQQYKE